MENCPRCKTPLVRGLTLEHKVCFDCPSCGGRLVTLPVLRDGLGSQGVAILTRKVREAPKSGCMCPTCNETMSILKVEVEGHKVEIDVCAKCLSVWCDRGEFESLVPPVESVKGPPSLHDLAMRTSPETRERLAQALLEDIPESENLSDVTLGDIGGDLLRLIIGAPKLWRQVRPVTPIVSIFWALALPLGQALIFCLLRNESSLHFQFDFYRIPFRLNEVLVQEMGFNFLSLRSLLTHPFLHANELTAILLSGLLFPLFALCEKKMGFLKFIALLVGLDITSLIAHSIQISQFAHGQLFLCGIGPLAIGVAAYFSTAYPNLRMRMARLNLDVCSYAFIVSIAVLIDRLWCAANVLSYAFDLPTLLVCAALGASLGYRQKIAPASP